MATVTVDGAAIAYENHGVGEPLLFIHGIYSSKQQWGQQVDYFKDKYRVITCDLRGHGQSSITHDPYSVSLFASDLIGLMDELGLEKVTCVGHSFGGLVAQEMALSYPERMRGIILAETLYGLSSTPWDAAAGMMWNFWLPKMFGVSNYADVMAKFFGVFTPGGADYIYKEVSEHLKDQTNQENIMMASLMFDSRWRLHHIDCPTLLMIGQYPHIPLVYMHNWEMYWRIYGAKLRIIPNAGHLLFWDNPTAFNQEMTKFLGTLN
ncbi:MAG: alpha/beta hydrolase [Anaerolineae bacterium]|nr:alpha/beta hydrolase [Anaerolineae bacterium]